MSKNKKSRKHMSYGTKCIITFILVIMAVSTVIICAKNGAFHFEAGKVTANDDALAMETSTPQESEAPDDESSGKGFNIFVTAGNGGTVNPSGSVSVEAFDSISLSFTPDEGYVVKSVTLDGTELGAVSSYTISYVDSDHTVVATFDKAPEVTPDPNEGGVDSEGDNGSDAVTDFSNGISEIIHSIFG